MNEFHVGELVSMRDPGSWVDGRLGTITALNVQSPDDICGHRIHVDGVGVTVVPPHCLEHIEPDETIRM